MATVDRTWNSEGKFFRSTVNCICRATRRFTSAWKKDGLLIKFVSNDSKVTAGKQITVILSERETQQLIEVLTEALKDSDRVTCKRIVHGNDSGLADLYV